MTTKKKPVAKKKTAVAKKKASSPGNLSTKELRLVDAIIAEIQSDNFQDLDVSTWVEATDNIRRVAVDPKVRPEVRNALTKAVKELQKIPAPTLKNILQLWHGATAFTVNTARSKGK